MIQRNGSPDWFADATVFPMAKLRPLGRWAFGICGVDSWTVGLLKPSGSRMSSIASHIFLIWQCILSWTCLCWSATEALFAMSIISSASLSSAFLPNRLKLKYDIKIGGACSWHHEKWIKGKTRNIIHKQKPIMFKWKNNNKFVKLSITWIRIIIAQKMLCHLLLKTDCHFFQLLEEYWTQRQEPERHKLIPEWWFRVTAI